jgi:NAD-dependent DNA ligase
MEQFFARLTWLSSKQVFDIEGVGESGWRTSGRRIVLNISFHGCY